MGVAFSKVLEIAESVGDTEYQLRALRGLYYHHTGGSRYRTALPFAQKFYDLTVGGSDLTNRLFGESMMGSAKHFLGDHNGARRHLEQVLTHYVATDRGWEAIRFQNVIRYGSSLGVSARVYLARVLWLQGVPDQAVLMAETSTPSSAHLLARRCLSTAPTPAQSHSTASSAPQISRTAVPS
jgi:hypothetical protein